MAEKVTILVLKVDLKCCRCYKKVKKVLCKFPQIQDQIYDEKANTVTITVVSCCPEKIRDKICCKGGGSIKSITIKPPSKPPSSTPTTTSKPPSSTPTKTSKLPSSTPTTSSKPSSSTPTTSSKPSSSTPTTTVPLSKPPSSTPTKTPVSKPPTSPPPTSSRAPLCPKAPPPIGFCCVGCYHGHVWGPCSFGGPPPRPRPCYETYGKPVYDSWGCGGGYKYCYVNRGDCLSEENQQTCTIM